jgi:acyl dehydratase
MLTISGVAGLRERSGQELGTSAWHTVTQAHIDALASATDDYERIHVDPERGAQTPFGSTIAHGLYTLSLGPKFLYEIMEVEDVPLALNYGFDRVRFIQPVPVGSRVRMRATLVAVEDAGEAVRCRVEQRFEIDGSDKPICVAESIVMYFDEAPVAA